MSNSLQHAGSDTCTRRAYTVPYRWMCAHVLKLSALPLLSVCLSLLNVLHDCVVMLSCCLCACPRPRAQHRLEAPSTVIPSGPADLSVAHP